MAGVSGCMWFFDKEDGSGNQMNHGEKGARSEK
jgi:hypothetical protein